MKTPKTFDDFKKLAKNKKLSPSQKVDFPHRKSLKEILDSIDEMCRIVPAIQGPCKVIVDIGSGCQLPVELFNEYINHFSKLCLVDSAEMLNVLPKISCEKFSGKFPNVPRLFKKYKGRADVVICNSVIQYFVKETGGWQEFIDKALELLKPGGQLLLSDIPNLSKAQRFFSTKEGIKYHQKKNKTKSKPVVKIEMDDIDDYDLVSIINLYRDKGYDAYLLPMNSNLEFSNRREHILIRKY